MISGFPDLWNQKKVAILIVIDLGNREKIANRTILENRKK